MGVARGCRLTEVLMVPGVMKPNGNRGNSPAISLPGKFLLTDSGAAYCEKKGIPAAELVTQTGRKAVGFIWKSYRASFLQKLVWNKLVGSIEIDILDFHRQRWDIIDITKLVISGSNSSADFSALIVLTESSVVAPFIYALF